MGEVTVYRFIRTDGGKEIRPQYMWGTRETIMALGDCVLLEGSARQVDASQVEGGFFFDIPESVSLNIDEPPAFD
jgi:hypothetical protein